VRIGRRFTYSPDATSREWSVRSRPRISSDALRRNSLINGTLQGISREPGLALRGGREIAQAIEEDAAEFPL
jgi:hypothetical protein